jgi:hypothetical protein
MPLATASQQDYWIETPGSPMAGTKSFSFSSTPRTIQLLHFKVQAPKP